MFKKNFYALVCGLLFSLGFAPFDLWVVSILVITCLLFLAEGLKSRDLFYLGYWFGFGMWMTGISWLYVSIHYHGNIGIIGSSALILIFVSILSIYSALTFLLYSFLKNYGHKLGMYFALPSAWVIIEIIRSHLFTGFPWLISGTMIGERLIDGFTPIIGAQGNTFFIILLASIIYKIVDCINKKIYPLPQFAFLILLICFSNLSKQIEWTYQAGEIDVSLHQPNLTLEEKWSQFGIVKTQAMIYNSIEEAQIGELVVFPETALVISENDNLDFMNEIKLLSSQKNLTLVTGIVERENNYKIRNRLRFLGLADKKYDKTKLVPFGEFIPLESILGNLLDILGLKLTNTTPGKEIKPIKSGLINLAPSICYEIAFDNLIREAAETSNILLTVSNDTWFGKSIGPVQHLQIAQNRALEHQKPLVRATNSGISAFLSQKGKIIEKQNYFEEKSLKQKIMLYSGQTFYTNWGNFPLIFLILLYFSYTLAEYFSFKKKKFK